MYGIRLGMGAEEAKEHEIRQPYAKVSEVSSNGDNYSNL